MIAAIVYKLCAGALEFGNHCRVISIASVDAFKHDHINIGFIKTIAHGLSNTLAVGLFVMQHSHLVRLNFVNDDLCSSGTLLVITANRDRKSTRLNSSHVAISYV